MSFPTYSKKQTLIKNAVKSLVNANVEGKKEVFCDL